MFKHIVFRIIAGLVLLATIAGIAFFSYQAGATHGTAANIQLPATGNGLPFYPHYGMHPFFGFGIFGVLFAFFLLALAFGTMRRLFWGPRWGYRRMHGPMGQHGPMVQGPWGEGVPPMFAEWHRRAHANPKEAADKKTG
jgi:hypothetical protein